MKASAIIRKLAGKRTMIWNDRLRDGRRSFKVWGWGDLAVRAAVTELRLAGFRADYKTHAFKRGPHGSSYIVRRIWVEERV